MAERGRPKSVGGSKHYTKQNKFKRSLEEEGEPTKSDIEEPIDFEDNDRVEIDGLSKDSSPDPQNQIPEVNLNNMASPSTVQSPVMPNVTSEYEPMGSGDSTIQIITKVDSPIDIKAVFWSFVTKDISMSNITDKDFGFILNNLTLRLYSFIQKHPIEDWDTIKFAEYDTKLEPLIENGKIVANEQGQIAYVQKKYIKNCWDFSELMIDLEEFVYHQLTRGRQGFTFRRITESFSVSEVGGQNEPTPAKTGWKMW